VAKAQSGLIVDIEPFNPKRHDRAAFSCGVARIDNYLKRTAKKHQKDGFVRLYAAVRPGRTKVLGYYAINAHAIEAKELPADLTHKAPKHGNLPAAYLSIIGVDSCVQGQGLGQVLMVDALERLAALSRQIGLAVVILDVLDDGGKTAMNRRRRFYERMGFQAMPGRAQRMFIQIKTIRAALDRP